MELLLEHRNYYYIRSIHVQRWRYDVGDVQSLKCVYLQTKCTSLYLQNIYSIRLILSYVFNCKSTSTSIHRQRIYCVWKPIRKGLRNIYLHRKRISHSVPQQWDLTFYSLDATPICSPATLKVKCRYQSYSEGQHIKQLASENPYLLGVSSFGGGRAAIYLEDGHNSFLSLCSIPDE